MSLGELLLIIVVALVVFGPNQLPIVARHLGKMVRHFNGLKQQAVQFWELQQNEYKLQDNIKKALKADEGYTKEDRR